MTAEQKIYRPRLFRDFLFNPIVWVIFVLVIFIFMALSLGDLSGIAKETNKPFWDVFWTPSQELYPNPIIGMFPAGIEMLVVALAIWALIVFFLWCFTAIVDKVILTDEFIQYYRKRIKISDIERIGIGEAGVSAITKIYPAVPQPAELPQAVLKGKVKFDLPRWLIGTDFFEKLKKRLPEIKINLPQRKSYFPHLLSTALFYFLIFIAIALAFAEIFYWLIWITSLPFSYLGSFNFRNFFTDSLQAFRDLQQTYPLIGELLRFILLAILGLAAFVIFASVLMFNIALFTLSVFTIRYWKKFVIKFLIFLGFLHLLGWLLYYFGILR